VPDVSPLELGDSRNVQVGDPTLAIGNPFGLDRTLTSGIVSALQAQIPAPSGLRIDNVIQTDAPVGQGDSGGPLLDATGRVIGINSRIEGGNGQRFGIQFAIPIDTAKELLPSLRHRK
jgi:S1-C subfamily serine protease